MQTYLLDTSAFRALPEARLAAAGRDARLSASPYCFWELLTHLEDGDQFSLFKVTLLKFQHVQILDDPYASVERGVVRQSDSAHEGLKDPELIYPVLAALRDSESVSEFYRKQIRDCQSQVREIAGCVSRIRATLGREEQRFQEYVTKIMIAVRDGAVSLATPADIHQGTLDVIKGRRIQLGGRVDQSDEVREHFARREYVYSSYILHRVVDYLARGATRVDPNDFEDAMFCQHLALEADVTAVTSDKALQRCLWSTINLLNGLPDESFHTKLNVCNVSEFPVVT